MQIDLNQEVLESTLRLKLQPLGVDHVNKGSQWVKGYLEGLAATLEIVFSSPHMKEEILKQLPDELPATYIPPKWFLYPSNDVLTLDFTNIASFRQIMYELLMSNRFSLEQLDKIRPQLRHRYLSVIASMQSHAGETPAQNLHVVLCTPRVAGDQFICEWSVSDRRKKQTNAYNFHGQNTSQWLIAGCILIDAGNYSVSIHT